MTAEDKISKRIDIYYAILAIAMVVLPGYSEDLLPTPFRVFFMILTMIPIFSQREYLSWVISIFLGVSLTSFSPIFPTDKTYYFPVLALLAIYVIISKHENNIFIRRKVVFLLLLLFCFFALLHIEFPDFIIPVALAALLLCTINSEDEVQKLMEGVVYASLILSVMFILYRNRFEIDYGGSSDDLTRTGWVNPNVYGLFVAGGSVIATAALLRFIPYRRNKVSTVLLYATCFLGGIVLCLNASRGAFISWAVCVALFILMTDLKIWYKILFSVLLVGVAYLLFSRGAMDLLLYRMQEDTMQTGGGRTDIWLMKLEAFFAESSPIELLFGVGKEGCDNIGRLISTHNDVVTSLVAFGFVGLVCYITFLFFPFVKSSSSNKKIVGILSLFLIIESCTQEPVFRGELSYLLYYFAVFFISQLPDTNEQ